jgi:NAD(P)-dependent dehydrogenase (short-subunit alcohol dehydrogenase family)
MSKVFLITGAARGMGIDIARAALAAGHRVVATARDPQRVLETVGEHENLLAVALDVTNPESASAAAAAAVDRFGRIDVLVNNAGNFYAGFFETISPEHFRAQMETNFFGPVNATRAILPIMRRQRSGHVVSISSTAGVVGGAFGSAYAASKFALEGWMEGLHDEVSPYRIRTTIVEPGFFRTELLVDDASAIWPDLDVEDYAERQQETLAVWKGINGRQSGDPAKFGAALITIVDMPEPPQRWVAGADAVDGVTAKADLLREQAHAFPELSTTLDHDRQQ